MKNKPVSVSVSPQTMDALNTIGSRYSLTGNQILAAAATELARIQPGDLWHALGRIAGEDARPAIADAPSRPQIARSRAPRAALVPV